LPGSFEAWLTGSLRAARPPSLMAALACHSDSVFNGRSHTPHKSGVGEITLAPETAQRFCSARGRSRFPRQSAQFTANVSAGAQGAHPSIIPVTPCLGASDRSELEWAGTHCFAAYRASGPEPRWGVAP